MIKRFDVYSYNSNSFFTRVFSKFLKFFSTRNWACKFQKLHLNGNSVQYRCEYKILVIIIVNRIKIKSYDIKINII